jgi:hypothetical protein
MWGCARNLLQSKLAAHLEELVGLIPSALQRMHSSDRTCLKPEQKLDLSGFSRCLTLLLQFVGR